MAFVIVAGVLLLLPSPALAQKSYAENFQVTASYSADEGEELVIYFNLVNNYGKLKGLELTFDADSAEYVHEARLGGKKAEEFDVDVSSEDGKTTAAILFPEIMERGDEKEMEVKFKTRGIVTSAGDASTMRIKFGFLKGIGENDERITIPAKPGVIRIHVPAGSLHTGFEPTPWREIWQGVSGFESHFVIMYDTVPLTQETTVTFKESETVAKASRVDRQIREAEGTASKQQISMAKSHLGKAIDLLISGTEKEADDELEKALEALSAPTGTTITAKETGPEPKKGICGPIVMLIMGIIPKIKLRCPQ
jgi:hypothetical protein